VKVFTPSFSSDEEMLYRFCRGVTRAGEFRDPNIVRLYRGGKQNKRWFLAMEWMPKGSLRDELLRLVNQPIDPRAAKRIGSSICRALETAHAKDLIHRNISPSSVLFDKHGDAKLGDFVLVRDADIDTNHQLTVTGQLLNQDIAYLAPEHALGRNNVDIRSDIYSLGATLYHSLAGRPPVEGKNIAELLVNIARDRPAPSLRKFNPLVSTSLEEAIQRSLSHDPRNRFQTPEEFREAIDSSD
jgi:serine/threonine-protein kinase